MTEVLTLIKGLGDKLDKQNEQIDRQGKQIESLQKKSADNPSPAKVFGIRKGENPLTSRPYSFLKAFGLYGGHLTGDEAKVELEISNRINEHYKANGYEKSGPRSLMIPFWSDAITENAGELGREIKSLVKGSDATDENEVSYLRKKYYQKDLSWVSDTTGGTLVPLAAQGELIELLRNKEALIQAGASTFPLPPQGSIAFPRQTGAMTGYWIGEKTVITKSDVGTGSVVLKAKKLACRGSIPNELFRYSNPAADAIVRNDIARVLALAMDLAGLQGTGGTQPTGITLTTGIGTLAASTVATNGDTLEAQDFSRLLGIIENVNGVINDNTLAFITRPKLFRAVDVRRGGAAAVGDQGGSFVEFIKALAPAAQKMRAGLPVVLSNQVSGVRVKGSGVTLTYVLCGDFSQWLIGMGGVMELDLNPWGDTPWQTDQTEIRGILPVDMVARHVESFAWIDSLLQA